MPTRWDVALKIDLGHYFALTGTKNVNIQNIPYSKTQKVLFYYVERVKILMRPYGQPYLTR